MKTEEIIERLDRLIEELPTYQTCKHSEVPEGRVWCSEYNQTFAGRCNDSCPYSKNKFLDEAA
jgi:hypothetical protein|tara:strand:+ start:534 stop:722 length:189 start_codon:yes stop_codon:yes gene_type:complete